MANRFATASKARAERKSSGERRPLDDYETPEYVTRTLAHHIFFNRQIWEPACGSGKMQRELIRFTGQHVIGTDIKTGDDFLKFENTWPGDIVTNPPYRDGLADAFVKQALKLADGRVAMLMESGYLWGDKRTNWLYRDNRPETVIVMPKRIYFEVDGTPIPRQFYNHAWLVWGDRAWRSYAGKPHTNIVWAANVGD